MTAASIPADPTDPANPADPAELLALARGILAAQPFSRHLGAELAAFGDGHAILRLRIAQEHRQQFGLVHGGVYAYLADNALTFAAGSVLGPAVLTESVSVTYVRPARDGVLEARARVTEHTAHRALCAVELVVVDDTGASTPCAEANGAVRVTQTP